MTVTVIVLIIIGIIICIASFFISEKFSNNGEPLHSNLMSVDDDYEFSERELRIIRRKIEDVIANQAKDILYETNDSLANMANEKMMALGDYAVAVCEQIEKNHKEVMFLYSMLDDKQKEIMKTVRIVNDANKEAKDMLDNVRQMDAECMAMNVSVKRQSALDQLTTLSQKRKEADLDVSSQTVIRENVNENGMHIADEAEDVSSGSPEVQEVDGTSYLEEEPVADSLETGQNAEVANLDDTEDVFAEFDQSDISFDEVLEEEFQENENSNELILQMHRNGNSILDIAKQLGLGVGEVKLVIDLYEGE